MTAPDMEKLVELAKAAEEAHVAYLDLHRSEVPEGDIAARVARAVAIKRAQLLKSKTQKAYEDAVDREAGL